jgi:tRNA-dihydrouridine synthase A
MMDRTDRHFRYLLRLLAPRARLYTEMITARALLHGDAERLLRFSGAEHPVALQLGGSDPAELAAAARLGEVAGYDEINLNVGCPSDRVQAGCFGAALMLEPERVADCVGAMREAVGVPVTVKTRLGVDDHDSYEFAQGFIARVAAAGCDTFIVHARKAWLKGLSPKQNREIPPLDYGRVYRLKRDFPELRIVINGGLTTAAATLEQLEHVDGVMLGRIAYQDSSLLAEIDARVHGGPAPREAAVLAHYVRYVANEIESGTPMKTMTRHLLGMRAGRPGGRQWRRALGELEGFDALAWLVRETFAIESSQPLPLGVTLAFDSL